jgi:hypothetical protein
MSKRKKKAICEFDSSNEQKEISQFNLFLAEKASVSKMTERAPESNDCHAIVAARCR